MEKIKKTNFAEIILILALLFSGMFYEYLSCAAAIAMTVWLVIKALKEKQLRFQLNIVSVSILAINLFYALTAFWAVDSGAAVIGFMKFLPITLYLLILMQTDDTQTIFDRLPIIAAVMTAVSAVGMHIGFSKDFFSVAGRLAGFFEYPNTFALFLLVAELLCLSKEKLKGVDFAVIPVLIFGILYSGSRTVFVLTVLSNAVLFFARGNKKRRWFLAATAAAFAVGIAIYIAFFGKDGAFGRFLTLSLNSSTFVGRLLYFKDALPLVLKHPFGLGYMGYYYIERSVQSGVYSVMFVHNDFLQLLLDVGWIPSVLFIIAAVKSVFGGKKPLRDRLAAGVILLHCAFDFDLQFVAMFMLFLLFTNYKDGKTIYFKKNEAVCAVGFAAAVLSAYFGTALALEHFGKYEAAFSVCPFDTRSEIQLLTREDDDERAAELADDIIKRNEYATVAYSVKARQAYSDGDFAKLIEYKNEIFEKAPFDYDEYEEYCYMLINGYLLYGKSGDSASAAVCLRELKKTAETVRTLDERLSELGASIKDQPKTTLPDDIMKYVDLKG